MLHCSMVLPPFGPPREGRLYTADAGSLASGVWCAAMRRRRCRGGSGRRGIERDSLKEKTVLNEEANEGAGDDRSMTRMRGAVSYQLVIEVPSAVRVQVGRLGEFEFPAGAYVCTGSARRNLRGAACSSHACTEKRLRWHIDYLLAAPGVRIVKIVPSRRDECRSEPVGEGNRAGAGVRGLRLLRPVLGLALRAHLRRFRKRPAFSVPRLAAARISNFARAERGGGMDARQASSRCPRDCVFGAVWQYRASRREGWIDLGTHYRGNVFP